MTSRPDADRCPGVLRPHQAVDGGVLRIRIPGGRISAAALLAVSRASAGFADGDVQLTSRANLQLRGVRTGADGAAPKGLVDELAGVGLLPHPTHERARNILCSPLTGRVGGRADLRPLIAELDATVCGVPELAALPGPFLFVLDDGRGDLDVGRADLGLVAESAGLVRLWAGGIPGPRIPVVEAAAALVALAGRFAVLAAGTDRACWHVRELPGGGAALLGASTAVGAVSPTGGPTRLGVLAQVDGRSAASVLVPLGRLTATQVNVLAAAAPDGDLIVTPWRGVIVPDVAEAPAVLDELTAAGLVADDGSPWSGVTACPGTRCARGAGDSEALARRVAGASSGPGLPVHVVACPRACGRPTRRHVLATVDRQRVEIHCGPRHLDVVGADAAVAIAGERDGGHQ